MTATATATKIDFMEYMNSLTSRVCHGMAYVVEVEGEDIFGDAFTVRKYIPARMGKEFIREYVSGWGADVEFIEAA